MRRHTLLVVAGTALILSLATEKALAKRTWDVIFENASFRCLLDIEGQDVTVKFYDLNRMGSYILIEHALALDRVGAVGNWVIQGQITKSSRGGMTLGMGKKQVYQPGDQFYLFFNWFTGDTLAALRNPDSHFATRLKIVERKGR